MSLNINSYGFIVGLACVVAMLIIEKKTQQTGLKLRRPNLDWLVVLLLMMVGARAWHVMTDWQLYQADWWGVLRIWRGGLSILGALLGMVFGIKLITIWEKVRFWQLLDLLAVALPWAQALGRWGNYFNQELYGGQTNLPWAININGQRVHPLFFYESVLMIILGLILWGKFEPKKVGTGQYFFFYLTYYLLVRFVLDFLRVQKAMFNSWLGFNQVIIGLVLLLIANYWLQQQLYGKKH